eukprot:254357_1
MTVQINNEETSAPATQQPQAAPAVATEQTAPPVPQQNDVPVVEEKKEEPTATTSADAPRAASAPPLADSGFSDTKPVVPVASSSPTSPASPVFTRADENRLTALTQRETDMEETQPLTAAEREELKELAARYQLFLDEGERKLREGHTPV